MISLKKSAALIFIAALALNHCLATGTNATYDVSRDFSETNPGNPWSYGSMETLGGDFTPFPALIHEKEPAGGTFTIWVKVGGGYPSVYYNGSSATIIPNRAREFIRRAPSCSFPEWRAITTITV